MASENVQQANFYRVVYLALCFLILFTAYCSAQNNLAQIYTQLGYGNLGKICLFCIFGLMGAVSAVAAYYKKQVSVRTGLILGFLCMISIVFGGAVTSYCGNFGIEGGFCNQSFVFCLNIVCASLVGAGSAFMWLCQATYVNDCANDNVRGLFNGTFWSIFQSAQILSGILATVILGYTNQFTFFAILMGFGVVSVLMLLRVQPPVPYKDQVAPVLEDRETFGESMTRFYECLKDRSCYFLFFALFFSGIAIGCYINFIGAAVSSTMDESSSDNEKNRNIGFVLTLLAFGEVAAGLSMGKLADKYNKIKLLTITMVVSEVALIFTFLAVLFKSYFCAMVAGFLWGYGDTSIHTMINAVIGSIFKGRVELFSAYRFFHAFGLAFASIINLMIPASVPVMYLIVIAGLVLTFHTLYSQYLPRFNKTSNEFLLATEKEKGIELENIY